MAAGEVRNAGRRRKSLELQHHLPSMSYLPAFGFGKEEERNFQYRWEARARMTLLVHNGQMYFLYLHVHIHLLFSSCLERLVRSGLEKIVMLTSIHFQAGLHPLGVYLSCRLDASHLCSVPVLLD